MINPTIPYSLIKQYYMEAYPFKYPLMEKRNIAAHEFILKNLKNLSAKSIFDIGAGDGYFLSLFKKKGWLCSGIEPGREMTRYAAKRYGVKIMPKEFENMSSKNKKYSLITMNHVFEHIYYMKDLLSQITSMLNEGGFLYIEIPSLEMFAKHDTNSELIAFTHLWHFTRITLSNLLDGYGFETVSNKAVFKDGFPVLRALFKQRSRPTGIVPKVPAKDLAFAAKCFTKQVSRREQKTARAVKMIESYLNKGRSVVFYGAGVDMYNLAVSAPRVINPSSCYIADSNPDKWGKNISGIRIQNPAILSKLKDPVVCVTSRLFTIQNSILKSIAELGIPKKNVILLFQ
jgi:SAM-dependent methyltransferase